MKHVLMGIGMAALVAGGTLAETTEAAGSPAPGSGQVTKSALALSGPAQPLICSAANGAGEAVFTFHVQGEERERLALRRADGTVARPFRYTHKPELQAVSAPVTQHILWLDDNTFACVSSGRLRSEYGIYMLMRHDKENDAEHLCCAPVAEGCVHFTIRWQVKEGKLLGYLRNGKLYLQVGR